MEKTLASGITYSINPTPVKVLKRGLFDPGRKGSSCTTNAIMALNVPLLPPRTQVPDAPRRDRKGSKTMATIRNENWDRETGV